MDTGNAENYQVHSQRLSVMFHIGYSLSRHLPRCISIEDYLKACAGKPDCTEMKMNLVISMSEQSGFPDFTLVSLHIVTVSTDDHSLVFGRDILIKVCVGLLVGVGCHKKRKSFWISFVLN